MALRVIRNIASVFSVLLTCTVLGSGSGFFLGEFAARRWERAAQVAFAEGSAFLGAGAAFLAGPILYYAVLKRRVSFQECATIVASGFVLASLVALLSSESEIVLPVVALTGAALAAAVIRLRRDPV